MLLRRLLFFTQLLIVTGLILSAFLSYINPADFWPAGFAGLTFPLLWILNLVFIPIWLIWKKKYWMISVFAFMITLKALYVSWGLNFFSSPIEKSEQSFTVMTFNASSMGNQYYTPQPDIHNAIYEVISEANPDILCIQEFYTNDDPTKLMHLEKIRDIMKYPYHYFAKHHTNWNTWHWGTIIYSRFPILDTARIPFRGGYSANEDLLRLKIAVRNDTVNLLAAHLASYKLNGTDLAKVTNPDAKALGVLGKMRRSFTIREEQARILRNEIDHSEHPLIVLGDFNDIPLSYTYNTIKSAGLQDAFLEKGSGFGRTFSALSPTLRIDYILPDKLFKVEDLTIYRRPRFEHFPVMTQLSVKQ